VSALLVAGPFLTGEGTYRERVSSSWQRLPFAPLEREMARLGGYYCCVAPRLDGLKKERLDRAWARACITGVLTWKAADQFAVELLGVHPYEIWGLDWFDV
jgi:hypothetical protein